MRSLIVFLSIFLTINIYAQELGRNEIADFTKEGKELISYLEYTLNAIGDNELSPKEKDIIISESFIKMFRDEKVQIEDDLDASREAVTNKDVQAYLKDVDFFFKYSHFTFNILSIDVQITENGNPFLLTNVLRTIEAVDLKGDTIKNDQQRFIEIELYSDKKELKIVSIYTTKLNENEENIRWWNLLSEPWKKVLGSQAIVFDTIPFSSIMILNQNYIILEPKKLNNHELIFGNSLSQNSKNDPALYASLYNFDTIWINDSALLNQKENVFRVLNQILEISDLNLSGNPKITDLEPIIRLSNLRTIDVSFSLIQDIYPVRNLTKLHNLNCSNTFINSVDPLIYSRELAILNISNTNINNLEPLANLEKLIILNISNTDVDNLSACLEMSLLEDLKMRNTQIRDLSPLQSLKSLNYLDLSDNEQLKSLDALKNLNQLKVLYLNNTTINDLSPLSILPNLETLYCENSEIISLDGLELSPKLKKIYCDNSLLGQQKAIEFMKEYPHILVVYESKQLKIWWDELPETWKAVFNEILEPEATPTKEQLHLITNIKEVNIAGNKQIYSLLPLAKLKNLQKLNASNTSINSLDGIGEAREMRELNISNTNVNRLYALESLNLIEELDISYCPVKELSPLKGLVNLKSLAINNTQVDDLTSLAELQNLRYLNAEITNISNQQFEDFIELKKDILLLYQSEELKVWWDKLSTPWKSIFTDYMRWANEPSSQDLHLLMQIQTLEIKENRLLADLEPVSKLKHLRVLKVNDTKISDVFPLKNLSYLQELDLSRNPISNLDPLKQLGSLNFLYLNNTSIDNLVWLEGLSQIKILDISGTEIKNLKELSNTIHLEKLIAYSTKVNNIKPLEDLPNLISLKIYNSKLSAKKIADFKEKNPKCEVDFY